MTLRVFASLRALVAAHVIGAARALAVVHATAAARALVAVPVMALALTSSCGGPPLEPACTPSTPSVPCDANGACACGRCNGNGAVCVTDACTVDADCAEGACAHDSERGDHCAAPAARGERCALFEDTGEIITVACASALTCAAFPGDTEPGISVCVPVDGPRRAGEPCGGGAVCDDGLVCDGAACVPQ